MIVKYSCPACGLVDKECSVRPRSSEEDVVVWMREVIEAIGRHHMSISPTCIPPDNQLHDLKIPMGDEATGWEAEWIGQAQPKAKE